MTCTGQSFDIEYIQEASSMGKSKRGDREYSREQRLIQENRVLKRQVASLRKMLARIDLDRYENAKELIENHYQEDRAEEGKAILENLKMEWKCHEEHCSGYLEIILYTRRDGTYYYRQCTDCDNRTKSQKYDESVKGIRSSKKE